ncbi:MAG: ATP-dependent zinc metalloprotease FtsH [Patescibacteria group bacterium]
MSNKQTKNSSKKNNFMKGSPGFWIFFAFIVVFFLLYLFIPTISQGKTVPIGTLIKDIKTNNVKSVVINQDYANAVLKNNKNITANLGTTTNPVSIFTNNGIQLDKYPQISIAAQPAISTSDILTIIFILVIVLSTWYMIRQFRSAGSGGIFSMGESKAKLFLGAKESITFDGVAGIEEAKEEVHEIVDFLKNPKKYLNLGARIPKGVLFIGAPGTGKTLLARAIAGESGVPFFSTSGSEFEEMLVGAGASRVRDLFSKARKTSPSIIFIDEIDAVARRRGLNYTTTHTEQTLNQILVEMDGFDINTNVIVIAATNRPDVLDPAILRPGRFDRTIVIDLPDLQERKKILELHARNKPIAPSVSFDKIAKRTIGYSGADLENVLNEAAIITAKKGETSINEVDIEEAATKVVMGPEKKKVRSDKERSVVAYHEAGHALISKFLPESDPVHRISIISRGRSGGATMYLPTEDNNLYTKTKMITMITHMLGGRAAEKIQFNDITNGASDDIKKASDMARRMITDFGMSDKLGPVQYGTTEDESYAVPEKNYSESTSLEIDKEISLIINDAYKKALSILKEYKAILDTLASKLIEIEVIEGDEFNRIVDTMLHAGGKTAE